MNVALDSIGLWKVTTALPAGRCLVIELAAAHIWYPQLHGNLVSKTFRKKEFTGKCFH